MIESRGAEAVLTHSKYLDFDVLVKERVVKKYRHPNLDSNIRSQRTKIEARLLHRAKLVGVRTPVIYKVDKNNCSITMEFIAGEKVKNILNASNINLCKRIGFEIGKLHSNDIIHGDITTSNMLLKDDILIFVDFGLGQISNKIEDKATDLLVFEKTFNATHTDLETGWKLVLEGYLEAYDEQRVLKRIEKIKERARYA